MFFFFSSRRRHTRCSRDWSSDVCSSDLVLALFLIVVPGVSFAGLIVNQAQQITGSVVKNPILGRIAQLELGGIDIGPRIADLGAKIVGWLEIGRAHV